MATVGVLGLGRLGLPLALVLDASGHQVRAWDTNDQVRLRLRKRRDPPPEPGVEELLRDHSVELTPAQAMAELCDLVFVATGSHEVEEALRALPEDRPRTNPPPVALASQVMVGQCERLTRLVCRPAGLGLVYTPLRVRPGWVVQDLRWPTVQPVGFDPAHGQLAPPVAAVLRTFQRDAVLQLLSYPTAEVVTLAMGIASGLKVSFANELALLAGTHQANLDLVLDAVGLLPYVNRQLLQPGSTGGGYLAEDLVRWGLAGGELGHSVEEVNHHLVLWAVHQLEPVTRSRSFCALAIPTDRELAGWVSHRLHHWYGWPEVAVDEAEVVVLTQPLRDHHLAEVLKPGATVLDYHRTHAYLADQGFDWRGFGVTRDEKR